MANIRTRRKIVSFRHSIFHFGSAVQDSMLKEKYSGQRLFKDILAGITVGIIAIPLSMALAIASGVPPQYGLYTALVAGILTAITGGSRFSISGPTAAFVVILFPVAQQYGAAGLCVASCMSGIFLLIMSAGRLGRLIQFIPIEVTLGFTMGIGIVIAILQIKDFFGLTVVMPEGFFDKVINLYKALKTHDWSNHWGDAVVGAATLSILILWTKLKVKFPGHLPAVVIGTVVSMLLVKYCGQDIATIGSKFTYETADGGVGHGIPPFLPSFVLPWDLPGPDGVKGSLVWNFTTFQSLVVAAFSMSVLGAIESLLCAVVLDGMTSTRHHSNGELFGQGLGNIVAPFLGGITSTAAIARSAANVKAGGTSPISSVVHALLVLVAILFLSPLLSELPLAAMSALLLIVAYNMSEWKKVVGLAKTAPRADILIMFCCIFCTVVFDMVVAITFGIIMASMIFMRDMAKMTKIHDLCHEEPVANKLADNTSAYSINGPLFFASAERVLRRIRHEVEGEKGVLLDFSHVNMLDAGGYHCLDQFCNDMKNRGTMVVISQVPFQPMKVMVKSKFNAKYPEVAFSSNLEQGLEKLNSCVNNGKSN
ncbi:MAG: C4-dicarboxylic acid transporter DauA [Ruminobacter sp.]|nr:C4-dicarboxylic acid transporter DauA [Ruminobacter sp.]